ncbi:hypothetical protein ACS0TY_009034 [Phlomoides rotata]
MGSDGAKLVRINVTGFKKFEGVYENPSEVIVNNLRSYVESNGGLPAGVTLGVCAVLETAGDGAIADLYKVLETGIANSNNETVIWLHLGVNNGANKFAIERQAVNEATFCCPDEFGWQPRLCPIILGSGGIYETKKTSCSIDAILKFLKVKGCDVTLSHDAGRFVCNFVYYHSLNYAEEKGHKSMFVHVPPFYRVDKETQMQFMVLLLEAIASTCC